MNKLTWSEGKTSSGQQQLWVDAICDMLGIAPETSETKQFSKYYLLYKTTGINEQSFANYYRAVLKARLLKSGNRELEGSADDQINLGNIEEKPPSSKNLVAPYQEEPTLNICKEILAKYITTSSQNSKAFNELIEIYMNGMLFQNQQLRLLYINPLMKIIDKITDGEQQNTVYTYTPNLHLLTPYLHPAILAIRYYYM